MHAAGMRAIPRAARSGSTRIHCAYQHAMNQRARTSAMNQRTHASASAGLLQGVEYMTQWMKSFENNNRGQRLNDEDKKNMEEVRGRGARGSTVACIVARNLVVVPCTRR
jgi:hypothetical protein